MSGDRNPNIPHDTEDKAWWLIHGENLEREFVDLCNNKLKILAEINPEKLENPTAPDLIVDGKIADLKVQNTPFFTASRYYLDPRYAVTFNRKDYQRYKKLYPEIVIYYWVDWRQTQWKDKSVEYLGGIFRLPFSEISGLIESGCPEHTYIYRRGDTRGNAKSSFLLDIRKFEELFVSNKR